MSLPPEILKKVKLLEISTRRLVNTLFAGEFHSAFKGQGMTFSEFREYVPGDDVRAISWAVTARTGKTTIKKFNEEREMTLMLLIDISGSMSFGTENYLKGEVISHLAALLAFAAAKNKDPVGLILFSDQVEHYVPPKKTRGHVHRILRDIFYHQPRSSKTNVAEALSFARGILKKRANIFVLSDFFDSGFDLSLRSLGRRHDLTAIVVRDPFELDLPQLGLLEIQDAESKENVLVDTSSPVFRRQYRQHREKQFERIQQELKRSQVPLVEVSTRGDYVAPLVRFFSQRNHR